MLERWTRGVVRFRVLVLLAWLAVLVVGILASTRLSPLLANSFSVPGTDSERARQILQTHFGERPDGTFTVVFRTHSKQRPRTPASPGRRASSRRAARGRSRRPAASSSRTCARHSTCSTRSATRARCGARSPAAPQALVTGQPAVQADLDPIFAADLHRGEAIAVPLTLLVLLAVFGLSLAVAIPFVVAGCTIAATLGLLYLVAHEVSMVAYVRNLVELIGLGLAVDYSLLDRAPLPRGAAPRPRPGRRGGAHDRDGRAGGGVLGRRGRDRARAPARRARAVHPLDGDRRPPDPASSRSLPR